MHNIEHQRLLIPVLRHYNRELKRHGARAKGVLWRDAEGAARRFRVLSQILPVSDCTAPFDSSGAACTTVHDFGCGYGALFHFLSEHPVMQSGGSYLGTDMSEDMLSAARELVSDQRARFAYGVGAAEPAEYTMVSGTFNLKSNVDDGTWSAFVQESLRELWKQTHKGLAFNLLHDNSPQQNSSLYYADARSWHRFARTLTPHAELLVPATRAGIVTALGMAVGTPVSTMMPIGSTGTLSADESAASELLRAVLGPAGIRMEPGLPSTDITILMSRQAPSRIP